MASSDENGSSDGETRTFKSYVQVPESRSHWSREERTRKSRRSRSRSPRYDKRQRGGDDRKYSDDEEEYYQRKRNVESFLEEKENQKETYNETLRPDDLDDGKVKERKANRKRREYDSDDDRGKNSRYDDRKRNVDEFFKEKRERRRDESDDERHHRSREERYQSRKRHRNRSSEDESRGKGRNGEKQRNRYEKRGRETGKDESQREGDETTKNVQEEATTEEKDKSKTEKPKDPLDILTRTGGAYIPPARLRLMQESIKDKSSVAYQRMAWEALKKSINGLVNKINVANIANIIQELFEENIIRGRGLFCQSVMRAQVASAIFTNVYAALIAIVNTKFPKIGELILRRLILQFRRAFRRNDKTVCLNSAKFIAHLVNQQVAHELLSLELLTLLLQNPTDDSVEVAVGFLKEVGQKLSEVSPRGLNAVFERLRSILNEGEVDKRVQYMLEVMFAIRKDGFKDHPAVIQELDLVEEDDQITHLLRLDDDGATEDILNVFKLDPEYEENEEKYKQIKKEILGDGSDDESGEGDGSDDDDDDEEDGEEDGELEEGGEKMDIVDRTETNLVALRRTIYLTIQSSLDYEECAHKMLKMNLKPGQEHEFCLMIIDCCSQQRTYEKFFGLLAQRFCLMKKEFMDEYTRLFKEQYDTIHRYDTNKLRNVAKFFGHLLYSDAIPWTVMECIRLNEEDTTSSSRIFIKILFQTIAEYFGIPKLNERIRDPVLAPFFEGMLPRDNPRDTRFAINFFTAIGLGGLTDDLREHLKNAPKKIIARQLESSSGDSSDSSGSSSDSSSDSDSSDDSESDSSDSEDEKRKSKSSRRRKSPTPQQKKSKDSRRRK